MFIARVNSTYSEIKQQWDQYCNVPRMESVLPRKGGIWILELPSSNCNMETGLQAQPSWTFKQSRSVSTTWTEYLKCFFPLSSAKFRYWASRKQGNLTFQLSFAPWSSNLSGFVLLLKKQVVKQNIHSLFSLKVVNLSLRRNKRTKVLQL